MGRSEPLTLRGRLAWLRDGAADEPFIVGRDPSGANQGPQLRPARRSRRADGRAVRVARSDEGRHDPRPAGQLPTVPRLPFRCSAARGGQARGGRRADECRRQHYDAAVDAATIPCRHVAVDGADLAAIVYTSVTIGWPKGVMVTNSNLLFAGEAVGSMLRVRPDDRWLVTLRLSHMNASSYLTMSALCAGGSIALVQLLWR